MPIFHGESVALEITFFLRQSEISDLPAPDPVPMPIDGL